MPDGGARARLVADGYLRLQGAGLDTTPRWQAALARAAAALQRRRAPWTGLKVPVAAALLEAYPEASDETLAALLEVLHEVEVAALPPIFGVGERDAR